MARRPDRPRARALGGADGAGAGSGRDEGGAGSAARVRGLTLRGWCFAATALVFGIGAYALRERDLLLVAVLAGVLALTAWLFVGARRPQLEAEYRMRPALLEAGESGAVHLRLTNTDRHRGRSLDVTAPATPRLLAEVRQVVRPLEAGASTEIVIPVDRPRRGRYRLAAPLVSVHDPLGLWEDRRSLPVAAELLVVPRLVPLAGLPRATSGRSTTTASSTSGAVGGDPDVGVRPYRVGDDIRTIHWRASARLEDDLVVRVADAAGLGTAAVVLDHRLNRHVTTASSVPAGWDDAEDRPEGGIETAVTLAASIGRHLLEQDIDVTLSSHDGEVLVAGHDVAERLLVSLVDAGVRGDADFHPFVPGSPNLVIAIIGRLTAGEGAALAPLRRPGTTAIAFVVTGPRGRELEDPVTSQRLRAAGWRVVAVPVDTPAPRFPGALPQRSAAGVPVVAGVAGAPIQLAWHTACSSGARDTWATVDAR